MGSHLCERFLREGIRVICVDNFITGDLKNIKSFLKHPRFRLIRHNVTEDLYLGQPIQALLHFASPASPMDYLKYPIPTLKVGSLGTHKMLGLAKTKRAVFLLASTSEVYGDPQVHPQREDYWGHVNPVGPRGVYDEAKRFAEAMTMAYHRVHGVSVRIARIFNTYGPRMRLNDGRAVPAFISQMMRGQSLTIFGSGKQTRSFCYVDDLVEGIVRLLYSSCTGPMNIGNPNEVRILDIARLVLRLSGKKGRLVHRPLPADDPKVRRPDISLARRVLKWEPQVPLEEGLRRTIEWFENSGAPPVS